MKNDEEKEFLKGGMSQHAGLDLLFFSLMLNVIKIHIRFTILFIMLNGVIKIGENNEIKQKSSQI